MALLPRLDPPDPAGAESPTFDGSLPFIAAIPFGQVGAGQDVVPIRSRHDSPYLVPFGMIRTIEFH
jgi:hypothetical protein